MYQNKSGECINAKSLASIALSEKLDHKVVTVIDISPVNLQKLHNTYLFTYRNDALILKGHVLNVYLLKW